MFYESERSRSRERGREGERETNTPQYWSKMQEKEVGVSGVHLLSLLPVQLSNCAYIVCLSNCPPHLMQVFIVGERQQGCVSVCERERHVARQKQLKRQIDTYKN